jgi:glycerol-3-phosphate dehydrogenase
VALAGRYGHAAEGVLELAGERGELSAPIVDGLPDLLAEASFAARHEQATSVADVLLRRTRLGLLAGRELCADGSRAAERVATAMAPELGWDGSRVAEEIVRFRAEATEEGLAG